MGTSSAPPIQYLIIGHLAKDLTPDGPRPGGTAAYAGLTARALGYAPGLVTAYGDDLPLGPLGDLPTVRADVRETTTFENRHRASGRDQFLRRRAAPIPAEAVPDPWRRAPIVHLGPLAQEVPAALAASFKHSFVGLTPQGWLRAWDGEGHVYLSDWPEAASVLRHARAAVLSLEDLGGDWATAERWAVLPAALVVTEGARGCTVFAHGEIARQFPAPAQVEVDPTGAGDVFAAAFFIHFYETGDPWAAAQLANQLAALSVTRVGLAGVPSPDEAALGRMRVASR